MWLWGWEAPSTGVKVDNLRLKRKAPHLFITHNTQFPLHIAMSKADGRR